MNLITVDTILGRFLCYDDTVGKALAAGQFWDQQIQPYLNEGRPGECAIDLGANIGWFSVYLARLYMRVIAVEAHPQTFELLQHNVRLNAMEQVVNCLPFAAYEYDTPLTLAAPAAVGWEWDGGYDMLTCPHPASIVYRPVDPGEAVQARGVRLDPLISPNAQVSLIKVDVQGCDLRALRGLRFTIERCRPLIIFEYEYSASMWNGTSWEDYLDFFEQLNYSVTRIREDLWDYVARPR